VEDIKVVTPYETDEYIKQNQRLLSIGRSSTSFTITPGPDDIEDNQLQT